MKNRDFIYWMEGFFELTNASEVTEDQFKLMVEHIKLVKASNKLEGFPLWMEGFMISQELVGNKSLDKKATNLLKDELKKQITTVMKDGSFSPDLLTQLGRDSSTSSLRIC